MVEKKSPGRDDIMRLLAPATDHSATEILALAPSWEEIETAAAYLSDETDVMGEARKPPAGNAGRILDIMRHDDLFDEEHAR